MAASSIRLQDIEPVDLGGERRGDSGAGLVPSPRRARAEPAVSAPMMRLKPELRDDFAALAQRGFPADHGLDSRRASRLDAEEVMAIRRKCSPTI